MKKKTIVRICALLAVLLIPVPLSVKDGGTIIYHAIAYSVEVVHRLNPDMDSEQEFLEGTIIKIFGIEVFNSFGQE